MPALRLRRTSNAISTTADRDDDNDDTTKVDIAYSYDLACPGEFKVPASVTGNVFPARQRSLGPFG